MKGRGLLRVVGGNWGRPGTPQQHRQPLADPPSPDSTDPKIWLCSNVIFTSSRSNTTVRTLNHRTSWAPRSNSIKSSAPSFLTSIITLHTILLEWVAPSTTITRWSLLRSWFSKLKELRNLLPSFMFILSITLPNMSIPDVPFPGALFSTFIKRRFQVKPATLLVPVDLFSFLLVEEFYGTQYQNGSFSLINVGSGFSLPT